MRSGIFCALIAGFALCENSAADTIDAFTFQGTAGANFTGSLIFQAGADGTASLADVIAVDLSIDSTFYFVDFPPPAHQVAVPAADYGLGDLNFFEFYGTDCSNAMSTDADGNRRFPATDTCDWINADLGAAGEPSLFIVAEFDPLIGAVELLATYQPPAEVPGFHGGFTGYSFSSVNVSGVAEPRLYGWTALALVFLLVTTIPQERGGRAGSRWILRPLRPPHA